jgi:hypothetical protein
MSTTSDMRRHQFSDIAVVEEAEVSEADELPSSGIQRFLDMESANDYRAAGDQAEEVVARAAQLVAEDLIDHYLWRKATEALPRVYQVLPQVRDGAVRRYARVAGGRIIRDMFYDMELGALHCDMYGLGTLGPNDMEELAHLFAEQFLLRVRAYARKNRDRVNEDEYMRYWTDDLVAASLAPEEAVIGPYFKWRDAPVMPDMRCVSIPPAD